MGDIMTEMQTDPEKVLERVDDAFFAVDRDWQFTFLNEQAATVLDVDPNQVIGEVVWDEFEAAAGSRFQSEYERAMKTQEPVSFEEYYPPLEKWFKINAYPSESGLSVYFTDITEQKQRKHELKRLQDFLAQAEQVAKVGRWEIHAETQEVICSDNLYDLLGMDRGTRSLEEHIEVYIDNDQPKVRQAVKAGINDQEQFDIKARTRDSTGTVRWMRIIGIPVVEDGETAYLRGTVQEITERETFEQQLVDLHAVSRDLLRAESETEIIAIAVDAISDILDVPNVFYYRHDPNDGVLKPVQCTDDHGGICDDLHPVRTDTENPLSIVFSTGETEYFEELDTSLHDHDLDSRNEIQSMIVAPVDNDGVLAIGWTDGDAIDRNMQQLVSIVATTTTAAFDKVQREKLLRGKQYQLLALSDIDSLIHGLAESVFGLSSRDDVEQLVCDRLANSGSYSFAWIGTEEDNEITVRTKADNSIDIDNIRIPLEESAHTNRPTAEAHLTGRMQIAQDIHIDPEYNQWHDWIREQDYRAAAVVPIGNDHSFYGTLNIYTDREDAFHKRERDALRRLGSIIAYAFSSIDRQQKLRERQKRIEFMHRLLRHNMLNSLNVVNARLELLDGRVDYEMADHLETAISRTSEMIQFVETIREMTKVIGETSEQELKAKRLDEVLTARVEAVQQNYPHSDIYLESVPAVEIKADDLLDEVFNNVLTNAVQHNHRNTPKIWVKTTVDKNTATVSIADNGPGVPDAKKSAILDEKSKTFQDPDSGFGLYLVKEIMQFYEGSVTVTDNEPEGSVFHLTFNRA